MSVKKKQVRYYHKAQVFRKSRSERTTRRKKIIRIRVDVSKPSFPYEEPKHCVKLAVHHGAAAFYTDYALRYDATCYCNELCDFVCGETPSKLNKRLNDNGNNSTGIKSKAPERPKSFSRDSGFFDSYFTLQSPTESFKETEFVNVDVSHQSVWFCRFTPAPVANSSVYITSSCKVLSESATENEGTGPPGSLCSQWHRDLQKSIFLGKQKSVSVSNINAFTDIRKSLQAYDRRERAKSLTRLQSSTSDTYKKLIEKSKLSSSYPDSKNPFCEASTSDLNVNEKLDEDSAFTKPGILKYPCRTPYNTPVRSRSTSFRLDI